MAKPARPAGEADGIGDLRGTAFEDLRQGMTAAYAKTISEADVVLYAGLTGDVNPLHLDQEYARRTQFEGRVAHGMLTAGLISAVIGEQLPGHGTGYMGQTLKFLAPVRPAKAIDDD